MNKKYTKVVSLHLAVLEGDDTEALEYALVDLDIANDGVFCLGTEVRDITEEEKEIVKMS